MALPVKFNSFDAIQKDIMLDEILEMNRESQTYGLALTREEAAALIIARNNILRDIGRIELDISVTTKIIREFQSSAHLFQEEYAEALNCLHEIFYYLKNATNDKIGDDDLIAMIKDSFENDCEGSFDLLAGSGAEDITRSVKQGNSVMNEIERGYW